MKLIFVYNSDSGRLNSYLDSLQKIVRPTTYDCNLCTITYGILKEKELWKAYRENATHTMSFLHRDEFQDQFDFKEADFPMVFSEEKGTLRPFISREELNAMGSAESLIELIMKRSIGD